MTQDEEEDGPEEDEDSDADDDDDLAFDEEGDQVISLQLLESALDRYRGSIAPLILGKFFGAVLRNVSLERWTSTDRSSSLWRSSANRSEACASASPLLRPVRC